MASWTLDRREGKELGREVDLYLSAVNTIREELLRDPVWRPEPCFVEGCEHERVESVA